MYANAVRVIKNVQFSSVQSESTPLITQVGHGVWATWAMWMAVSGDGLGERKMSSERRQIS